MTWVYFGLFRVIQDGTDSLDNFRAAITDRGNRVLLVGYTYGNWSGVNAGASDSIRTSHKLSIASLPCTITTAYTFRRH